MEWLGAVGTIFGLAGTVGGVVGFLSYGRAKTIIELQQDEIKAREERYNTITAQYTEVKAQASAAEEKAKVLEGLVTQTPGITKLAEAQAKQHKEVMAALAHLIEVMSNNAEKEQARRGQQR